jgi:outer membrane usher protein
VQAAAHNPRTWIGAAKLHRAIGVWLLCGQAAVSAAAPNAPFDDYTNLATLHYRQYELTPRDDAAVEYSIFNTEMEQTEGALHTSFAASTDTRLQPLTRLETAWSGHVPLTNIAMRLGDAVSNPSTWSQAVRFGGVKIGSMQELPDDVVTAPELSAGKRTLASAADLITHNANQVAGINAPGEVLLTVSDVLGRMQAIVKPLHTNIAIAGKGKTDYSLATGRVREEFALQDGEYGERFTSATLRYGLRRSVTVDAHVSQLDGVVNVMGAGLAKDAGRRGKLSAAMATSRNIAASDGATNSEGWLARLAYQYENEFLVFAVRTRLQSPTYRDLGSDEDSVSLKRRTLASVTLRLGSMGDLLLAGAAQEFADASRSDFISLRHSVSVGGAGSVSASLAYHTAKESPTSVYLALTHPFDGI